MCGIWAIINQKEEPFDYQTFCTLGCANDRRGGDSCGVFIDGVAEYGIGQKALFENFFWTSDLLNNTAVAKIALGHDRKASIGGISLEKAHPIIISEPVEVAEGEEPKEEVKFVLIHNGTIYNYEDLAKKYIPDVDIKDMSDSQVIARLLYYSGYDWLAEYNGGAAFVAVDYREKEPKVVLWRGESKKFESSTEVEEERPLYCNVLNGRLVVSSICSYLSICDGNCYVAPANKITEYRNGKLWIIKEIDRSKAQQNKKYEYAPATNNYRNNAYANVSKYIRSVPITNTYKIGSDYADGLLRISSYGKVLGKNDAPYAGETAYKIYFFNGIPLKEEDAYKFLYKAWKRSKLTLDGFCNVYQNLIRYFSLDQLYYFNNQLFKATTPWDRSVFSGYLQMLTDARATRFLLGREQYDYKITTVTDSFALLDGVANFDYKTIWKQFIQSMA